MYRVFDQARGDMMDEEFENRDDALARCLFLARENLNPSSGIDPDDIGIYDNGDDAMGACPDGNDGAYWPYVRKIS
jgi:hypothetical protein